MKKLFLIPLVVYAGIGMGSMAFNNLADKMLYDIDAMVFDRIPSSVENLRAMVDRLTQIADINMIERCFFYLIREYARDFPVSEEIGKNFKTVITQKHHKEK